MARGVSRTLTGHSNIHNTSNSGSQLSMSVRGPVGTYSSTMARVHSILGFRGLTLLFFHEGVNKYTLEGGDDEQSISNLGCIFVGCVGFETTAHARGRNTKKWGETNILK